METTAQTVLNSEVTNVAWAYVGLDCIEVVQKRAVRHYVT